MTTNSFFASDRFQSYVSQTIAFETGDDKSGAYTNDPSDPGLETKWGISKKAHPELAIKPLTYKDAINVYYTSYWNPLYDLIPNDPIAFKLFDMGVLSGIETSIALLQRSIRRTGRKTIAVDGNFGPVTMTALSVALAEGRGEDLYQSYVTRYLARINRMTLLRPWLHKYKMGWTKRIAFLYLAVTPQLKVVK